MSIYRLTGSRELNVKALVGAFNQEKALVGAFSVIVTTDGSAAISGTLVSFCAAAALTSHQSPLLAHSLSGTRYFVLRIHTNVGSYRPEIYLRQNVKSP